jgi:hypothetical protein
MPRIMGIMASTDATMVLNTQPTSSHVAAFVDPADPTGLDKCPNETKDPKCQYGKKQNQ